MQHEVLRQVEPLPVVSARLAAQCQVVATFVHEVSKSLLVAGKDKFTNSARRVAQGIEWIEPEEVVHVAEHSGVVAH